MTTMKKKLSPGFTEEVRKMLPRLRKETEEELVRWDKLLPENEFYADEEVIKVLPFSAYEYLRIGRNIRVDKRTAIEWLNDGIFNTVLDIIVCHALRKLALQQ